MTFRGGGNIHLPVSSCSWVCESINNLWPCVLRGQFEEMCAGLLAKVEGPLRSVMEQASEYSRLLIAAGLSPRARAHSRRRGSVSHVLSLRQAFPPNAGSTPALLSPFNHSLLPLCLCLLFPVHSFKQNISFFLLLFLIHLFSKFFPACFGLNEDMNCRNWLFSLGQLIDSLAFEGKAKAMGKK